MNLFLSLLLIEILNESNKLHFSISYPKPMPQILFFFYYNKDYPRSAPSICVMTPNGRWEPNKNICLSATVSENNKYNKYCITQQSQDYILHMIYFLSHPYSYMICVAI